MVDEDEMAELRAQQRHDRRVALNERRDPRDPDYEHNDDEEPE